MTGMPRYAKVINRARDRMMPMIPKTIRFSSVGEMSRRWWAAPTTLPSMGDSGHVAIPKRWWQLSSLATTGTGCLGRVQAWSAARAQETPMSVFRSPRSAPVSSR
ncbi:hypothetical protein ACFFX0_24225 [Citricoccus parietis]|uniref:Uncharacterized protein n=1 Tax=Citricoccus parietis TaxID=592307 RepID=A0ABV5G682_9MICC